MINFPYKKIYGVLGADRAGKNTVANYLQETRNFATFAFADKIKQEFGISKEDFEASKIAGNIEDLRQKLWDFSASKREKDPFYFIRKVINDTIYSDNSVIITDIRTMDEMNAFFDMDTGFHIKKLYLIKDEAELKPDDEGNFSGTKLPFDRILGLIGDNKIKTLINRNNGLFNFLGELDKFFFIEDVLDLAGFGYNTGGQKRIMSDYLSQFNVSKKNEN
jgi:hypothetical protein